MYQKIRIFLAIISFCFVQSASAQKVFPAKIVTEEAPSLTIYSSLDQQISTPLLEAFQKQNPTLKIIYEDLQTLDIYERIIRETDENGTTADLVFSSAMDLQMKLVNDGYAQRVNVANARNWPGWANWRNTAFALTYEPSVVVYHKPSFTDIAPPQNRKELREVLRNNSDRLYGKVGTYDIERSGLGYLFLALDQEHSRNIWSLVRGLGATGVKLYSSSSAILERVSDGRFSLGYNILGSYAANWAKNNPDLGIILPNDYTIVMSRIALVPVAASSPEYGALLLNFLMSETGQQIMANEVELTAIHPTLKGKNTARYLRSKHGNQLRPIPVSPGLLVFLDQVKRARLIKKWNDALRAQ